jgi:ABC-type oligopeptide transport system substrate-binding subunit
LFELAEPRRSIVLRGDAGALSGTGPFGIEQFGPGSRVVLEANDDHWAGRPFLDSVVVETARAPKQQILDLELGEADLVELQPGDVRRAVQSGMKVWSTAALELLALRFTDPSADASVRRALALSLDRAAILSVLLQKQGEPAGGLLPQWLSGYAFLFPASRDPSRARELVARLPAARKAITIACGAPASLDCAIAERIALDARQAGIALRVVHAGERGPAPPVSFVRVPIEASSPERALASLAASLGLSGVLRLPNPAAVESLYAAERDFVEESNVIPLFHLPELYGAGPRVRTWATPGILSSGEWRLDDVWLAPKKP